MAAQLTKPLIVPEFLNGIVKLYLPDPVTGATGSNSAYEIDFATVYATLGFTGPQPNACAICGNDLFVALSSDTSQAIMKFPGYLSSPAAAVTKGFVFTLDGSDYVGLTFDKAGNLFAAEGAYANNSIYKYTGTGVGYPGAAKAKLDNYATRTLIGNAGMTSYFADPVFDAAGNLWVTDYQNHRLVVFDAANLGGTNTWHVLGNLAGPVPVANTDPALNNPADYLFAEPEGSDFDGYDGSADLWVANNNDGGGAGNLSATYTSIVRITKALRDKVLATAAGGTYTPTAVQANGEYFIYQVPVSGGLKAKFGGLKVDVVSRRIFVNEEASNKGRWYDIATIKNTSAAAASSILGIVSTDPGNGGIELVNRGLYIQGDPLDTGIEPSSASDVWEAPGISITQNMAAGPLPLVQKVKGGLQCVVYVEIRNGGLLPSTGTETVELLWGKASAGLGWPDPWRGGIFDAAPYSASSMGGLIASIAIPPIPAGSSVVLTSPAPPAVTAWTAPDPSKYNIADGHFCLLARIVSVGGMHYPETSDLPGNVRNNAMIAWLNIHIVNPITGMIREPGGVIVANYRDTRTRARLSFELLGPAGRRIQLGSGQLVIEAHGKALEKLRAATCDSRTVKHLGSGQFRIKDLEAGIGPFPLSPGEMLPMHVQYFPVRKPKAFALRVIQYEVSRSGERRTGGQTFVMGKVKGFHV